MPRRDVRLPTRRGRWPGSLLGLVFVICPWTGLEGHGSGLSSIQVRRETSGYALEARLPITDLKSLLDPSAPAGDDLRTWLATRRQSVLDAVSGTTILVPAPQAPGAGGDAGAGGAVAPAETSIVAMDPARVAIRLRFGDLPGGGPAALRCDLFTRLDPTYRIVFLLHREAGRIDQVVAATGEPVALAERPGIGAPSAHVGHAISNYVVLGMEHIFLGYDHILFLIGLILLAPTLRNLVTIVTFFTVGHSLTLALAGLAWVTLPGTVVEPAIALSICYVAVENVLRPSPTHRGLLTFLFGLVHGFGFAGVLQEIGLPPGEVVPSLFGFNVGVEIGQLLIVLVIYPFLRRIAGSASYRTTVVPAGSLVLLFFGLAWFFERVWGA